MMGSIKGNMGTVSTSQHWSALRTDDDIQKSVSEFLEEESHRLHGKNLHESIVEVSRWLGSQIQQEREGWAYKIRAAMQEIENHRCDALRVQGVIQECAEQLRLISECCNMEEETLQKISSEEPKHALPMYIECLTEIINALVEDRLQCLQLLQKTENDKASVFELLKEYMNTIQSTNQEKYGKAQQKATETEAFNKTLVVENMKLKKQLSKTSEDLEKLKKILHIVNDKADFDYTSASTELPSIGDRTTPASLQSEPTPTLKDDSSTIHISEDRLHKLRRSAKKLESSLQDALDQMDNYRRTKRSGAKQGQSNIKLRPLLADGENNKKHTGDKILTPSKNAWNPKFEVSGKLSTTSSDKQNEKVNENNGINKKSLADHPKRPKHEKFNELREETVRHRMESQERLPPRNEKIFPNKAQNCTFKSLVRSLDEMRTKKFMKNKDDQLWLKSRRKASASTAMESVPEEEGSEIDSDSTPNTPPRRRVNSDKSDFHLPSLPTWPQHGSSAHKKIKVMRKKFI